jgi:transcriptional regulator with XRE-family HTH domain
VPSRRERTGRVDIAAVAAALDAACAVESLSFRQVAREIGVSPGTITRLRNGFAPDGATMILLLAWLRLDPRALVRRLEPVETRPAMSEVAPRAVLAGKFQRGSAGAGRTPVERRRLQASRSTQDESEV